MSSDDSQASTPGHVPGGAPIAHMGNLAPSPAMGHPGIGQHDLTQAHMHQQMNASQGNMGPPQLIPIDPSIGYMTAAPHHQQHGMQQIQGGASGGYGMSNESS